MKLGVQTFTIRKKQKKSIRDAYLPLIKMGIKYFEVARIGFTEAEALEIRGLIDEYGIEISAVQVKPGKIFESPEKIIAFCKKVGCSVAVISMLPFECILGREEKFYSFVDSLDSMAEKYEKEGITLAYHHHNWEYVRLKNGKRRMQELISRTSRICFVHDTYWTSRCGVTPSEQIAELGSRLVGIHLRDLAFRPRGLSVIPYDTFLGGGVIDFASVLSEAERVGCRYLAIEQKTDTPYIDIEKSKSYIEKLSITL